MGEVRRAQGIMIAPEVQAPAPAPVPKPKPKPKRKPQTVEQKAAAKLRAAEKKAAAVAHEVETEIVHVIGLGHIRIVKGDDPLAPACLPPPAPKRPA
jgi:hypothetical protein